MSPSCSNQPGSRSQNDRLRFERGLLTIVLLSVFTISYFGVGLSTNSARVRELFTSYDAALPFWPPSVWIYLGGFPAAFLPVFVVRCTQLLRRTAVAYLLVIAVSLCCFVAFPVTTARLRANQGMLVAGTSAAWAIRVLYSIDPPYNAFPSLHISISSLAAFSAWKVARTYGVTAFSGVALLALSVCTIKQHFLLDVAGGFGLAMVVGASILVPCPQARIDTTQYSRYGAVGFLFFVFIFYIGLFFVWSLHS